MSIKNNLYNLFGGGGRALVFLLTIPLMVNYMGVEVFGVWALITAVGSFALLLDVGIASTTMHFISRINAFKDPKIIEREINSTIPILLFINITFSITISVIFVFFTEDVASFFLSKGLINEDVLLAIKAIGGYSSLVLMQHFFSGIIQAHNQFLLVNIIKFFNILIINLGLLFLSYFKQELHILSFYMLGASFITLVAYIYLASKKLNILSIKPIFDAKQIKEVLNYSGSTWMGYLGGVLFTQLDKIIVGKVCNTEIVGIYAAIISITSYISSIATVGLQPIIPKLSELWVVIESKKKEFIDEYKLANQFNTFIVILMSTIMLLLFKPLLTGIMDVDVELYPEAVLGFKLAIIIYAFNSLSVPGFYGLMAIKKTKYLGKWQIIGALIALSLIYLLGKRYGLYGVIIGNTGLFITVIFNSIMSRTLTDNIFKWVEFIYKAILLFVLTIGVTTFYNSVYIKIFATIISIVLLTIWFFNENQHIWNKLKTVLMKSDNK